MWREHALDTQSDSLLEQIFARSCLDKLRGIIDTEDI